MGLFCNNLDGYGSLWENQWQAFRQKWQTTKKFFPAHTQQSIIHGPLVTIIDNTVCPR